MESMMKQRLGPCLFLLVCTVAAAWTAPARGSEVYTWTDENGVVHYSDAPSADKAAKIVEVEEGSRPESGDADPYPAEADSPPAEDLDSEPDDTAMTPAQQKREKLARERAERREEQAETERLCTLHRQRLERMEPARRIFHTNEQGESVRLDDDRRLELIDESRDFLADNCD
jgi:hypothetical protein